MILKGYELNGFSWVYCDKGLNCFQKRIDDYKHPHYGEYLSILCTDNDIIIGNYNEMTRRGLARLEGYKEA